jgi:hypothetical protein
MLRTFEIYANDNFLGYEYAEDDIEAIIKTRNKFGAPKSWGTDEYTARKIMWKEDEAEV